MSEEVGRCYDQFAASYHLIFEDWEASMARQAAAVGPILERECGEPRILRILDCACGIGTQALGLAKRGHIVTGCDLSAAAVDRASAEARGRGLDLRLFVADMLDLTSVPENEFDAVVCLDNALPHLDGPQQLLQAATQMRMKLKPGGTWMASIRDYDHLVRERPAVQGPAFYNDRRYTFHLYITLQTPNGWESRHFAATYRAILRDELTAALGAAGFTDARWLFPPESGFYQPLLLAKAGDG